MKSKLNCKVALLFLGAMMMFGFSASWAQSNARKVEKSFLDEMKIVDAAYAANIKQDKTGAYLDYNKQGLAAIAKKKYENQKIEFTNTDLRMPANDHEKQVVLEGYPQRIAYLQAEILKMKNSVDIFNAKRDIQRMLVVIDKVKNNNK